MFYNKVNKVLEYIYFGDTYHENDDIKTFSLNFVI